MLLADEFDWIDVLWIALSAFLVVVGVTLAYLLVRMAATTGKLGSLLKGLEGSVIPLVDKTAGTVDRVNLQLDKVDRVTDSAVDAADAADTAIRAVSMAITRPVQLVSGLAKGISHGASAFFAGNRLSSSIAAGRDAAARREREIAEELARTERPAPPPAETMEAVRQERPAFQVFGTGGEPEPEAPPTQPGQGAAGSPPSAEPPAQG